MPIRVETVLSERTYERLRRRATEEDRTVEEVVREAVERYLRSDEVEDPLDDFIGAGTLPAGEGSEDKDWRKPWGKDRGGVR